MNDTTNNKSDSLPLYIKNMVFPTLRPQRGVSTDKVEFIFNFFSTIISRFKARFRLELQHKSFREDCSRQFQLTNLIIGFMTTE